MNPANRYRMITSGTRCNIAAAWIAAAVLLASFADAAPRVPVSGDVVLERLPPAFLAAKKVQGAPSPLTSSSNLEGALATARHYIEVGQTYSDPRAYGYAQAALGKWWDADPAPAPVLVMRARILQFRHEFKSALANLEAALKSDQFDPDAWLLLASIEQVQGNVAAARAACLKLIPMADLLVGATCVASTTALSAHAAPGEKLLAETLQKATTASASELTWAWTTLAEIRARRGEIVDAESAFKSAIALEPDDVYSRAAYADLLLDQNRPREVRVLLGDTQQADALLLRAALAAQRNGDPDAAALRDNLADRFAEARERSDQTHLREQARFTFEVMHDVPLAMDLAKRNFAIQREPADARVLLEVAAAADDAVAAKPALDWLRSTAIEAPHLQTLATKFSGSVRE